MRRIRLTGLHTARLCKNRLAVQAIVIEVEDELIGDRLNPAVGRIFQSVEEQFSAQPSRQRAYAVAVGRDSVDIVVASKSDLGVVMYQHSGRQPLSLNRDSPGLQHLVAAVIASAEASGYRTVKPPLHQPVCCEYVGDGVLLKHTVSDPAAPMSPSSTQVYQVDICRKYRDGDYYEQAILKICPSPMIRTEVQYFCSVCHPGQRCW